MGESSSLDANAPTRWRFDGYELDLRARELRDPQGARLAIEARSFDLLALLIRERERALDKQELLDRVWNGRIVTDASITQAVFKLRRLLGERDAATSRIRTVHGHGFQWVGAVSAMPAQPAEPSVRGAKPAHSPRPRWSAAAFAAALGALSLLAIFVHAAGQRPFAIAIAPVRVDAHDETLAWMPEGLRGLMAGLLARDRVEVDTVPLDDTGGDKADAVVLAKLARKGPLFSLELETRRQRDAQIFTDILIGDEPAKLAVDAALRVRRHLGLAPERSDRGNVLEGAPLYVAETYARGLAALAAGHLREAADHFRLCVDQAPLQAWPRLKLAQALGGIGEIDEAYALANALAAGAHEDGLRGELEATLGRLELWRNRPADAAAHFETALGLGRNDVRLAALEGLGLAERARGRFDTALHALEPVATELERSHGDRALLAETYNALGALHSDAGRLEEATTTMMRALDLYRALGKRDGELLVERNLSAILAMRWRPLDALPLALDARASERELADAHQLVWADTSIADSLAQLHAYPAAHAYSAQAVAIAARDRAPLLEDAPATPRNSADRAQAWFILGYVDVEAERHAEAASALAVAATLNRQAGNAVWTAWSLYQACVNALANGDRLDAERHARELAQVAAASGLTPMQRDDLGATAIAARAELSAAAGDLGAASADFAAALERTANPRYQHFIRLHWARCLLAAGRSDGVAALLDRLADWREQSVDVRELEVAYAKLEGRPTQELEADLDRLRRAGVIAEANAAAPIIAPDALVRND
ncbi:MAG TPA: winged helix-turn-helix domain-containing protein [Rudaea sp.]|nr:winged helix-turn-helix domain-containing protein [Rudaea sp.]